MDIELHPAVSLETADRMFCFYETQAPARKGKAKAEAKISGTQASMEAFS